MCTQHMLDIDDANEVLYVLIIKCLYQRHSDKMLCWRVTTMVRW
jgi:hypothetical protein